MNEPYSIRPARIADLPQLVRLEQRAFVADRFSRRQIRYLLTRASGTALVLESGDSLVGAAYLLWRRSAYSGRLYNIAVDPAAQGKGLGALLLRKAEGEAIKRGCRRITLEVRSDNTGGIAFYEKHGYRAIEQLPGYYEGGVSGLRMSKQLVSPPPD